MSLAHWMPYWSALPLLLAAALPAWLYSVWKRNVNITDTLWSLFFLLAGAAYLMTAHSLMQSPRAAVVMACVTLWAIRLALHLGWRNHGAPEDRRYFKLRVANEPFWLKSLYIVFGLQAALAWFISLPLFGAIAGDAPFGLLDYAATALWLTGFLCESIADWQLARFRSDPRTRRSVMRYGLWRYSRHPNYFGECCLWWGFYLFACAAGAWWSLPAPLLMSFLLLRVSGVALLEADIGQRRPEYAQYVRSTSSFIPRRPQEHPGTLQ